jgi:cytochrome c-type biogenesis protein CcmH/NrfG
MSAKGEFAAGILAAQAALRLDDRNVTALCVLAAAHQKTGRISEAIAMYDRALAIDPQNMEIRYVRDAIVKPLRP